MQEAPFAYAARRGCEHLAPTDRMEAMRWLVDGMNVIGTRPDRWWKDRDAAMLRLVDQLERWAAADGEAPKPKADAADDEIVRLLKADDHPHAIRVVTSDRGLSERASAQGATVEGADSFRSRIESI